MRFQGLALGAAIGLGACLAGGAASAQAVPIVSDKREFKIGGRVTGTYDDNVSRSSKTVAAARGLQLEDYLVTPSATVAVNQPFGRQAVFLQADVGYVFYRDNDQLNSQRVKVNGGAVASVGPCQPYVVAGYQASQNELANIDLGNVDNVLKSTNVGAGMQCGLPAGPAASVFAQRTDNKNDQITRKTSDNTTEILALGVQYTRATLGTLSVGFNYASTEFPNRIIPGRPIGDGFFTQSYSLGYERDFGTRLKLTANGAATHLKREFAPPGQKLSFTSPTYAFAVNYQAGPRIDLQALAQRAITPSQQLGKSYDKATNVSVVANYHSGTRLTFSAGAARQEIDSNADTSIDVGPVVTNSRTNSVYGTVTYSPSKVWSLALNVRQEDRKANLPDFNYTSTRVGLTAQVSF